MDTGQWLTQYKDKVEGIRQAAAEVTDNITAATVTTSSPDGSVTVTIGPNGSLRDLRFGNRASEHSHTQLAALVMKTVARGQRAVAEKVVEAFAPIGAGTSAMDLLTKFVPEEVPDERPVPSTYDELAVETPPAPTPPVRPQPVRSGPAPTAPAAARPRPARPVLDDADDFNERPW
ncbi:DNA-binding protein YbaB [Kutzneria viridogrisea]|uniref:YbaB/EbfC DNA-binding family protein n=2 Tax=Kutzneria TaxID=43356 RepID=W5WEI5_9PSEU|nr:YbaB/EbfC family nucleoid-associated protein [Kutzneria albida]AHH99145.1 hypothetical protein KALB_5784 [Kutzneria albida DSM 43870]MBA8923302.1 DNA-binding protein YbaB [Kutzneria viridogrisea]